MNKDNLLQEVISIIKPYGVKKIILFGSYAKGNPNTESDIDLLVIKEIPEDEVRDFRIQLKKQLWITLSKKFPIHFDIIVDDESRINKRIAMGDLFYKEIYTKGKTIYA
ncbi:MAG: nucleotidyltransferase domain-containing protein [Bacteroidales bacterium]|nr:nucleotidyltransferase domain-containing protein [Bacteroidales bacterium]